MELMTILSKTYDDVNNKDEVTGEDSPCELILNEDQAKACWHTLNICLRNDGLMPDHYKSSASAVMTFLAVEIDNLIAQKNNEFNKERSQLRLV